MLSQSRKCNIGLILFLVKKQTHQTSTYAYVEAHSIPAGRWTQGDLEQNQGLPQKTILDKVAIKDLVF